MVASGDFRMSHNVTFRVLDSCTGKLVKEYRGHNAATNTLIEGIGHYLAGEGVLRQGYSMLSSYIPKYISLGTMGLRNQDADSQGLPTGISGRVYTGNIEQDFANYIAERPGFGSDGYRTEYNNNRPYFGLGPAFTSFSPYSSYSKNETCYYQGKAYRAKSDMHVDPDNGIYNYWNSDQWELVESSSQPLYWELISPTFPRQEISFRDVLPEYQSEKQRTIDVVFSAMISTGALDQFRAKNKNYLFISEAGLWSDNIYHPDGQGVNGLVAGYRLAPPNPTNWYMNHTSVPDQVAINYCINHGVLNPTAAQIAQAKVSLTAENRKLLQQQILRVEVGQVVQVIWKITLGNVDESDGFM